MRVPTLPRDARWASNSSVVNTGCLRKNSSCLTAGIPAAPLPQLPSGAIVDSGRGTTGSAT